MTLNTPSLVLCFKKTQKILIHLHYFIIFLWDYLAYLLANLMVIAFIWLSETNDYKFLFAFLTFKLYSCAVC